MVDFEIVAKRYEFVSMLLRAILNLVLPERPGIFRIPRAAAQIPKDDGRRRRNQSEFGAGISAQLHAEMPEDAHPVKVGHRPFGFRADFPLALLGLEARVELVDAQINPDPLV